jgi:hypothetical protein
MNFKNILLASALSLGMVASAQAVIINVGGVIWNTDQTTNNPFPSLEDFNMRGSIIEDVVTTPGDLLTGFGEVLNINSQDPNKLLFCPGCELTFTFSAELVSFTTSVGTVGTIGNVGDFVFKDLVIEFFVQTDGTYVGTSDSADDGALWLKLESDTLSGFGATDLGTGADKGSGLALLNVTGGDAMTNFDTNLEPGGFDMVLDSSFQGIGEQDILGGNFQITGNSIAVPEPSSLALLGLGMLGLGFGARRKNVK